jgi:hypothetical protein
MRETEDDKDNDDTGPPRSASLSRVRFRRLLGLPEFPDTIMGVKAALAPVFHGDLRIAGRK